MLLQPPDDVGIDLGNPLGLGSRLPTATGSTPGTSVRACPIPGHDHQLGA